MTSSTPLGEMFKYKAWANTEMLAALRSLGNDEHEGDRSAAIYILNHTYLVDRIFAAHLTGAAHSYTATTEPEAPAIEDLERAIKASDQWYVDYVSRLTQADLDEVLDFAFTDGDLGRMSRAEILVHLVLHGGYHRGGIGRILAQLSRPPPKDTFTRFLHGSEASLRRRVACAGPGGFGPPRDHQRAKRP